MVTANRIRLTGLLRRSPRLARASLFAVVFVLAPPSPQAPIPSDPPRLAKALGETSEALVSSIAEWKDKSTGPPADVVLYALFQQRIYRDLARNRNLADATLPRLTPALRTMSRDVLIAHRELYRLTPPLPAQ